MSPLLTRNDLCSISSSTSSAIVLKVLVIKHYFAYSHLLLLPRDISQVDSSFLRHYNRRQLDWSSHAWSSCARKMVAYSLIKTLEVMIYLLERRFPGLELLDHTLLRDDHRKNVVTNLRKHQFIAFVILKSLLDANSNISHDSGLNFDLYLEIYCHLVVISHFSLQYLSSLCWKWLNLHWCWW